MSGGDSREVTPVPMPNTEVKFSSADGSWDFVPVRVGRCQAEKDFSFSFKKYLTSSKKLGMIIKSLKSGG